jgi:hypothetical protein
VISEVLEIDSGFVRWRILPDIDGGIIDPKLKNDQVGLVVEDVSLKTS